MEFFLNLKVLEITTVKNLLKVSKLYVSSKCKNNSLMPDFVLKKIISEMCIYFKFISK